MSSQSPANQEIAETPVDRLRNPNGKVTVRSWSEFHNVYRHLLPFGHRKRTPIDLGLEIHQALNDVSEYANELSLSYLGVGESHQAPLNAIFRAHKLVPVTRGGEKVTRSNQQVKYRNPEYTHYEHCLEPITDYEQQVEFYHEYATIGTQSKEWFAKHLDLTIDDLQQIVQQTTEYETIDSHLNTNRRRLTRTLYTAHEWTGCPIDYLTAAFNIPSETAETWLNQWVRNQTWSPPEWPVNKSWFPLKERAKTGEPDAPPTINVDDYQLSR